MNIPSRRLLEAGPLERKELLQKHGETITTEERDFRETAEEEEASGDACIEALYEDAPRSAWILPFFLFAPGFIVVLVVMLGVAGFFNGRTLNLSPVATVMVGLGLPLAIVVLKAAGAAGHVGRISELLAISKKALRGLGWATVVTVVVFVLYGVARSWGALDETVALLGLMALELVLGFCAAELLTLALVHGRAPLHFLIASHCKRAAAERAPFVGESESIDRAETNGSGASSTIRRIHRHGAMSENNHKQEVER